MRARCIVGLVGCILSCGRPSGGSRFNKTAMAWRCRRLAVMPPMLEQPSAIRPAEASSSSKTAMASAIPPFGGYQPERPGRRLVLESAAESDRAAQGSRSSMSAQSVSGTLSNGARLRALSKTRRHRSCWARFPSWGGDVRKSLGRARWADAARRKARAAWWQRRCRQSGRSCRSSPGRRKQGCPARGGCGRWWRRGVGSSSAEKPALSVAEIRRQQQWKTAEASVDTTSQDLVEHSSRASEGKMGAARVYYQQALHSWRARRSSRFNSDWTRCASSDCRNQRLPNELLHAVTTRCFGRPGNQCSRRPGNCSPIGPSRSRTSPRQVEVRGDLALHRAPNRLRRARCRRR